MPGAYAHIAIVNAAQKLSESVGLRDNSSADLASELRFLELGSVSPDYPYLSAKPGESLWADHMHYSRTGALLREGVAAVRRLSDAERSQGLAWLMGFAAHITTDMTIHPVIEQLVGPYALNKGMHRRCEMHQDAYIFPKVVGVGEAQAANHLSTGVGRCHLTNYRDRIDATVRTIWLSMLSHAYPEIYDMDPPEPDSWHKGFNAILNTLGTASQLFPFARHVSANLNLQYPRSQDVDDRFVFKLETPEGKIDYNELFERARNNVLFVWKELDVALSGQSSSFLESIGEWDLDTGRDKHTTAYVFWNQNDTAL